MAKDDDVLVVGVGMITAVGLTAGETAASVRSATARFTEVDWRDERFERFTMAEVIEDGLPDLAVSEEDDGTGLTYREARLLRLGIMPLLECRKLLAGTDKPVGLALALPEMETTLPLDRLAFLKRFAAQTGEAFDPQKSDGSFTGRAGGLLAIAHATKAIQAGQSGFLLAGGIDTYRDLYVLGTLDMEKRVKSSQHLDGFIPGEGAGFLLLASRRAANNAGLTPLAHVSPVAEGTENGHFASDEPYRGEGLAAAIEKFFQESGTKDPIREVYSSMNGENYWAKEWGVAFLRNQAAFSPNHGMHHPADCFGDTGAACGPLLAGLAVRGIAQGYRRSPCLVYCSSDYGQRAVLAVSSA